MSQKTLGVLEVQAIDGDLQCAKNPDPSKMAILRTYTPLLYRFKPFHWRAQEFLGWVNMLQLRGCSSTFVSEYCFKRCTYNGVGMAQLFFYGETRGRFQGLSPVRMMRGYAAVSKPLRVLFHVAPAEPYAVRFQARPQPHKDPWSWYIHLHFTIEFNYM